MVATLFIALLATTADAFAPPPPSPGVRLGGLFAHSAANLGSFMAFVMAVQEINNSTDVLPQRVLPLRFAVQDSACEHGHALLGAHHLVQTAFSGLGSNAIIGATCSSASSAAAMYLTPYDIPQLSPSSTSAELSDSTAYPFFARTLPSDAFQGFVLADLVEGLLGATRFATASSTDSYGVSGMQAFKTEAARRDLQVLASTEFANDQLDLSANVQMLRQSGALVIVLFCQTADAPRFIEAMQQAGEDNVTWVGSDKVTNALSSMTSEQVARLRGFAGLAQPAGTGDEYLTFTQRLAAFSATVMGDGWCSNATDDDGRRLWSTADGGCMWTGGDSSADVYAPFAYDAVYAMARALNQSLAAAPDNAIDGAQLMSQLLSTTFMGASGLVSFDQHGDRNAGIRYDVFNVGQNGPVLLGKWQVGVTWASRFAYEANASYTAADGSDRAPELADNQLLLRLGILCVDRYGINTLREECDHVHHTVDRLNDKTDGWYDELLPNLTIVTATASVGCVQGFARPGWQELQESLPGFTVVIGPSCSNDVADVAGQEWRTGNGSRAVVISPSSTAPALQDETAYPNLARASNTDVHQSSAFAALCATLAWDRVAILHDDSLWGSGTAGNFLSAFEGEVLSGGMVSFSLSDFDSGTVHARELLASLSAAEPSVIMVATQPRVQRAVFAWAYEHQILYGPGFGWVTFWVSEDMLFNEGGFLNASAMQGAEGLIGLRIDSLSNSANAQRMIELWRQASSSDCDSGLTYCDADGNPALWPDYAPNTVDAVLLFAHAMDELRRTAPASMKDPDALYSAILNLPAFEGMSGRVVLGAEGDRLGKLTLVNLQICFGSSCGASRRRRRLSLINVGSTFVSFVEVGTYDALRRNLTVSLDALVFSQGTSETPLTTRPPSPPAAPPPSPPPGPDILPYVLSAGLFAFFAFSGGAWMFWRSKRHYRKVVAAEAEAATAKEQMKAAEAKAATAEEQNLKQYAARPSDFTELFQPNAFGLFGIEAGSEAHSELARRLYESEKAACDSSASDDLAKSISELQEILKRKRDNFCNLPHVKKTCEEEVLKGRDNASMFESIFNTHCKDNMDAYNREAKKMVERGEQQQGSCLQGTRDLAVLYRQAVAIRPRARQALESLEKGKGMLQAMKALTRTSRASEKIVLQPHGETEGAEKVYDIVRDQFVCDTMDEVFELLSEIASSEHIEVVHFNDRFNKATESGWRDAVIRYRVKRDTSYAGQGSFKKVQSTANAAEAAAHESHICQLQIVHKKMLLAREQLISDEEYSSQRSAHALLDYLGDTENDAAEWRLLLHLTPEARLLYKMLLAAINELGYTEPRHAEGSGSRFTTPALVFGLPVDAARGLAFFCDVAEADLNRRKAAGLAAIEEELRLNGSDVDRECLEYVLEREAGSSDLAFQGGLLRDCDAAGNVLASRQVEDPSGCLRGMRLDDFVRHPHSQVAGLTHAEVAAIRLYSTAAFRSFNAPLRDFERHSAGRPHPLAVTVSFLQDAVKKLRSVDALSNQANDEVVLWRGMANRMIDDKFLQKGGTEVAPMSTTAELKVAVQYSASAASVLLRLRTTCFMARGADISFLSSFPAESECLFPPLTYLMVTSAKQEVTVSGSTFTVIDVVPMVS